MFPPGGSNDIVGRIVFQKMSEQLGQQFVIDNRGGAAGTIGSEVVAKSPPDGYTIMVQSATHVANAHLYKKLPYDTLKDFIGITHARAAGRHAGRAPVAAGEDDARSSSRSRRSARARSSTVPPATAATST